MTPAEQSRATRALAARAPVIPVIVIDDPAAALPLGRALVAGGLTVLEVTLRTEAALGAIAAMRTIPGAVVGAGTVLTPAQARAAAEAGAGFAVSPGLTPALAEAATALSLPLLPGAVTPSEAMAAADLGYDFLKFFPAAPYGGPATLAAFAGPLPQLAFCPTGGVTPANAGDYLALANVICVGGSWMLPAEAVAAGDWGAIEAHARAAAALGPRP